MPQRPPTSTNWNCRSRWPRNSQAKSAASTGGLPLLPSFPIHLVSAESRQAYADQIPVLANLRKRPMACCGWLRFSGHSRQFNSKRWTVFMESEQVEETDSGSSRFSANKRMAYRLVLREFACL